MKDEHKTPDPARRPPVKKPPLLFEKTQAVINELLFRLNETYAEMGQHSSTDFDERNSHDNTIVNIMESEGLQIFYQLDKDWHYRLEERRWVSLNDKSSWRKVELSKGKPAVSIFHVR